MKTLGELIDEAMASGDWYGITIFADRGYGPQVNLLRGPVTAVCGQVTDPDVPVSVRLGVLLVSNLKPAAPALFDDLLGD